MSSKYLENVVNELERKDDLVYTLTCETNDETNSPCTNEIENETTFPSTNGTILTNSIDKLVFPEAVGPHMTITFGFSIVSPLLFSLYYT